MKIFCQKFLLFITVILLFLGGLEILSRKNDISSTAFQVQFFKENIDSLEGIAFGPSHLWRGMNPKYMDHKIATFALFGSAPNIDVALCETILEKTSPKFIIFDLSQGYLQKHNTREWTRSRKLGYYFGVGDHKKFKDYFLIDYPLLKHISNLRSKIAYTKHGFPEKTTLKRNVFKKINYQEALIEKHKSSKSVLKRHNVINIKYFNKNIEGYKEIIKKAKSKNIKTIFVSTPKYHIYNNGLPSEFIVQRSKLLNSVVDNEMVFFLDFERSFENEPNYFLDINHLNITGAKKFTEELNKKIKLYI